jgi:hypothetical protein
MVGVLGRWGDSEHPIAVDVIRSICRQAENTQGGINHYLNARSYPAVLVFTAYGLGLTRSERWGDLHGFLTSELSLNYPDHPVWMVEGLFLWRWRGGDPGLWNDIKGDPNQRYHTPLSDWLANIFREWGKSFLGVPPDYDLLFDKFELLASLAHFGSRKISEVSEELQTPQRTFVSSPVGRVGWNSNTNKKLFAELQADPTRKPLMDAGFAHGSSEFIDLYMQHLRTFRLY